MLNQFIAFLTPKIDPAMRDYEGTYHLLWFGIVPAEIIESPIM